MATLDFKPGTKRSFREEVVSSSPRNVILVPDGVLIDALSGTSAERRVARAELAVRYYLSPRKFKALRKEGGCDVAAELSAWIGPETFMDFMTECGRCESCVSSEQQVERAFRKLTGGACRLSDEDVVALRSAFLPWLIADGVIPVFNSDGSYILPFSFGCKQVEAPRVTDWEGQGEFEDWTAAIRRMDVGIDRDIRVAIDKVGPVKDCGNSLMLPVLMAWWRSKVAPADRLPRYSPIRFIATGAFEGGRVGEVQTGEKEAKIDRDVDNGFLVRPGGGQTRGSVPVGSDLMATIGCIREMAELQYDAEPANADRRLVELDDAVRRGRTEGLETLIQRLDRLWGVQDPDVDEEGYLRGLMLRSAARCHAGMTEEALKLNCEAMDKARGNARFLPQFLRLRIEELVLLEDEEDFARTFALAADLEKDLDAFSASAKESDRERALDLEMRFHGTMGQAVAYAAVSGAENCSPEAAKRHFETAFKSAVELARRSKDRTGCDKATDEADYNCGHDANYLLLWAALFSGDDIPAAAEKARRFANRSRKNGVVDDAVKNDRYRHRYEALGHYRAVLAGQAGIPSDELSDIEREVGDKNCDPWIRATIGKYLGAIAAARGDAGGARKLFDRAVVELKDEERPLFRIIHMTVLAEAYRSLRQLDGYVDVAEDMRKRALAVFASAKDSERWNKTAWRDWLMVKGEDAKFPGLQYWY